MREMTLKEYCRHIVMEEVRKDAEKEGIRIIPGRSKPRLVEDDNVVRLPSKGEGLRLM